MLKDTVGAHFEFSVMTQQPLNELVNLSVWDIIAQVRASTKGQEYAHCEIISDSASFCLIGHILKLADPTTTEGSADINLLTENRTVCIHKTSWTPKESTQTSLPVHDTHLKLTVHKNTLPNPHLQLRQEV